MKKLYNFMVENFVYMFYDCEKEFKRGWEASTRRLLKSGDAEKIALYSWNRSISDWILETPWASERAVEWYKKAVKRNFFSINLTEFLTPRDIFEASKTVAMVFEAHPDYRSLETWEQEAAIVDACIRYNLGAALKEGARSRDFAGVCCTTAQLMEQIKKEAPDGRGLDN